MFRLSHFIAAALAMTISNSVLADDDLWFGVKAGTLGLGVEATWRPVPYLDVRAGYNGFNYDDTRSEAGLEYDGELDLSTAYATANFRVPLSPFRVTAGVFSNSNEVLLTSRDSSTFLIGDTTFQAADVGQLQARGEFDSVAPYAGIGLDFRLADTFALVFDAGVLFQGEVDVIMSANGPIANNPVFLAELERERQELQDSIDEYEYYPVVSIGFSVNF